jgi:hypothetical protein
MMLAKKVYVVAPWMCGSQPVGSRRRAYLSVPPGVPASPSIGARTPMANSITNHRFSMVNPPGVLKPKSDA